MRNFNDEKTDAMLRAYCTRETETFTYKKPKKLKLRYPAVIAACLAILIIAGICLVPKNPTPDTNDSFTIVANAHALDASGTATGDEITTNSMVTFNNPSNNFVYFDFDENLYDDAYSYDITKRFLPQSFCTNLNVNVVGENIKDVTYKCNRGAFNAIILSIELYDNMYDCDYFTYSRALTEYTYHQKENKIFMMSFNPVYNPEANYDYTRLYYSSPDDIVLSHHSFIPSDEYIFSEDYDELCDTYGWTRDICFGYRSSDPTFVTQDERNTLRAYAEADEMVSFLNYQNQIFKRLVDGTEIEITVTYNSGKQETKTLELTYNPTEVTDSQWYEDSPSITYSNGNISAILK